MLTENTGIAMLDSGGESGRKWQRNQGKTTKDFENEPQITFEIEYQTRLNKDTNRYENDLSQAVTSKDINYTVSAFHYLSEVLVLDDLCRTFNRKKVNDWDSDIYGVSTAGRDWILAHGFKIGDSWNSYNGENTLDTVLQGTNLKHDSLGDYILLQIHGGCDVRGGYTDAKLVKVDKFMEGINPCPNVFGMINGVEVESSYNGVHLTDSDGNPVPLKGDGTDVIELSL